MVLSVHETKPGNNSGGCLAYLSHQLNLLPLLVIVRLVDANLISPRDTRFIRLSEEVQRIQQILVQFKACVSPEIDCSRLVVALSVRQALVMRSVVQTSVLHFTD